MRRPVFLLAALIFLFTPSLRAVDLQGGINFLVGVPQGNSAAMSTTPVSGSPAPSAGPPPGLP